MSRYATMFRTLRERGEGAFIPFVMLGDPTPEASLQVVRALIAGGADALELGIPFSDPIADGPTIQAAAQRALAAGTTTQICFGLLARIREAHPDIPIGLLVYANLVVHGGTGAFYGHAARAGVDSVLVADVPTLEAPPFVAAATQAGVEPVLIAPPDATTQRLATVARLSRGYTYVLARAGVTGTREAFTPASDAIKALERYGAPPCVFGFGISHPEHVRAALSAGAAGAISGSAVVRLVASGTDPGPFVAEMKAATR